MKFKGIHAGEARFTRDGKTDLSMTVPELLVLATRHHNFLRLAHSAPAAATSHAVQANRRLRTDAKLLRAHGTELGTALLKLGYKPQRTQRGAAYFMAKARQKQQQARDHKQAVQVAARRAAQKSMRQQPAAPA